MRVVFGIVEKTVKVFTLVKREKPVEEHFRKPMHSNPTPKNVKFTSKCKMNPPVVHPIRMKIPNYLLTLSPPTIKTV